MAKQKSESPPSRAEDFPRVAEYKRFLADVVERRPTGTRQRLATALGKNRSFISQITNPIYQIPIPAAHVEVILEICRFSNDERQAFLELYYAVHPKRKLAEKPRTKLIAHTLMLPDLGSATRNAKLQTALANFARDMAALIEQEPK
jgi:hypothetical protein